MSVSDKNTFAPQRFPWQAIFRLAMANGLSPEQVWRMTPVELNALLPENDDMTVTPSKLEALMARYPDKLETHQ